MAHTSRQLITLLMLSAAVTCLLSGCAEARPLHGAHTRSMLADAKADATSTGGTAVSVSDSQGKSDVTTTSSTTNGGTAVAVKSANDDASHIVSSAADGNSSFTYSSSSPHSKGDAWDTAPPCKQADTSAKTDNSGRLWGWENNVSCAFKAPVDGGDAVWEAAKPCAARASADNVKATDNRGRKWGWENGASCAFKSSGNRKLLWGHFGLFGGNHWNWFSNARNDHWGWSTKPQQESQGEETQQASPVQPSPSPSTSPSPSPSPSPAPAKDTKVNSEEVGAPADSTEVQGEELSSRNNSSGGEPSKSSDEPAAQAQGVGYKLADGDIVISTQAQAKGKNGKQVYANAWGVYDNQTGTVTTTTAAGRTLKQAKQDTEKVTHVDGSFTCVELPSGQTKCWEEKTIKDQQPKAGSADLNLKAPPPPMQFAISEFNTEKNVTSLDSTIPANASTITLAIPSVNESLAGNATVNTTDLNATNILNTTVPFNITTLITTNILDTTGSNADKLSFNATSTTPATNATDSKNQGYAGDSYMPDEYHVEELPVDAAAVSPDANATVMAASNTAIPTDTTVGTAVDVAEPLTAASAAIPASPAPVLPPANVAAPQVPVLAAAPTDSTITTPAVPLTTNAVTPVDNTAAPGDVVLPASTAAPELPAAGPVEAPTNSAAPVQPAADAVALVDPAAAPVHTPTNSVAPVQPAADAVAPVDPAAAPVNTLTNSVAPVQPAVHAVAPVDLAAAVIETPTNSVAPVQPATNSVAPVDPAPAPVENLNSVTTAQPATNAVAPVDPAVAPVETPTNSVTPVQSAANVVAPVDPAAAPVQTPTNSATHVQPATNTVAPIYPAAAVETPANTMVPVQPAADAVVPVLPVPSVADTYTNVVVPEQPAANAAAPTAPTDPAAPADSTTANAAAPEQPALNAAAPAVPATNAPATDAFPSPSPEPTSTPSASELFGISWENATVCVGQPSNRTSVQDLNGRLWWVVVSGHSWVSCAYRAADGSPVYYDGYQQVQYDRSPYCDATPTIINAMADSSGRLWGWKEGQAGEGINCRFLKADGAPVMKAEVFIA